MSLPHSYMPNYYSIEDILATQERVPCKFMQTVPHLGKLDSASEGGDLKAGTDLELPLWLVRSLTTGRDPIVRATLPKIYKESYREILKADPSAVDLHKINLYFYEFGGYIKKYDPRNEVRECLEQTFQKRFRHLMDLCEYTFINPDSVEKLDLLERRLYHDGYSAKMKLYRWLNESRAPIEAAEMVTNHKKRKRIDMESNL